MSGNVTFATDEPQGELLTPPWKDLDLAERAAASWARRGLDVVISPRGNRFVLKEAA